VNAISNYLKPNMPLPQYLPYARFLLDTDLSHTAKLLYTLLLDRATLSQKNNWVDERGFVYVIFPISSLSEALRCSTMSIKRALRSLEDAETSVLKFQKHMPTALQVPDRTKMFLCMERFCPMRWNRNDTFHGTKVFH
jgi:hypothetical protein